MNWPYLEAYWYSKYKKSMMKKGLKRTLLRSIWQFCRTRLMEEL